MTKKKHDQNDQDVSLMAHDQYMHVVRWTPPLPTEEEVVLFQLIERGKAEYMQSSPDQQILQEAQQARDRLVAGFQGFVIHIAKQYCRYARGLELLDLIQEGNLGVWNCWISFRKAILGCSRPLNALMRVGDMVCPPWQAGGSGRRFTRRCSITTLSCACPRAFDA